MGKFENIRKSFREGPWGDDLFSSWYSSFEEKEKIQADEFVEDKLLEASNLIPVFDFLSFSEMFFISMFWRSAKNGEDVRDIKIIDKLADFEILKKTAIKFFPDVPEEESFCKMKDLIFKDISNDFKYFFDSFYQIKDEHYYLSFYDENRKVVEKIKKRIYDSS